jgi:hypothetical protein
MSASLVALRRDVAWVARAKRYFVDALGLGAGGLAEAEDFAAGFFAEDDALADALGATDATGSGVGEGAGVGAGVGLSTGFGAQMSPPEGPTAVGVGGDGRGELPHAANAAKETTSATSRATEARESDRADMARMVARKGGGAQPVLCRPAGPMEQPAAGEQS